MTLRLVQMNCVIDAKRRTSGALPATATLSRKHGGGDV